MTQKDIFKILLYSYGYDRNVRIDKYYGDGGFIGYEVYAENKEGDYYSEGNCEGFMFHVFRILEYMKDTGANFKTDYWNLSTKDLLNDEFIHSMIIASDKREEENKQWGIRHRPLEEWKKQNNPCPTCTINKKDHWDDIHYKCELNHNHTCTIMLDFWKEVDRRRIEIDKASPKNR